MPTSAEPVRRPMPAAVIAVLVTAVVAAVVAAGFGLAGVLTPRPAAPAGPGYPALLGVHLGGEHLPVLVTPARAGVNLVLLGGSVGPQETVRVGLDPRSLP